MDLQYATKEYLALNVQAISSSTTTAGTEIDTQGYDRALLLVTLGARTDGTLTPLIEESDTSGSGFTAVSDDYLHGTEAAAAVSAANTIKSVGVVLTKRYLKVSGVSSSVTSGFTGGIVALLSNARHQPTS